MCIRDRSRGATPADPARAQLLKGRLYKLPADLQLEVESTGIDMGLKKMGDRPQTWQLGVLADLLDDAEERWNGRKAHATQWISQAMEMVPDLEEQHIMLLASTRDHEAYGLPTIDTLMEMEAEHVSTLCEAIVDETLMLTFTDDDEVALITAPTYIDRLGGKSAVLKAGKAVAKRTGLKNPRSSANVTEAPLMAAMVASDLNNTQQGSAA